MTQESRQVAVQLIYPEALSQLIDNSKFPQLHGITISGFAQRLAEDFLERLTGEKYTVTVERLTHQGEVIASDYNRNPNYVGRFELGNLLDLMITLEIRNSLEDNQTLLSNFARHLIAKFGGSPFNSLANESGQTIWFTFSINGLEVAASQHAPRT